jgi:hypothetical protein
MTYRVPQDGAHFEPAPNVATLEEIQFAEELRHRLQLRLLPRVDARIRRIGAQEDDWEIRSEI